MFRYKNSKTYKGIIKKKNIIFLSLTLVLYIYLSSGITYVPVENVGIISGIGADILNTSSETVEYDVPLSVYNYTENSITYNIVHNGFGYTIGKAREDRQLQFNKKFIVGLARIAIFSEAFSEFSISPVIDILFTNPNVNDTALSVVCKGKAEDLLRLSIPGYSTSSDYIEGLLKDGTDSNFLSDNYKIMDIYVRMDAEGRNIMLPYIEIKDNIPKISAFALFDKDKMVCKIGMEDARALNLLRENNVRGILSIIKNSKEYIDFFSTSKRKVKCEKINGKYIFTVDLSLAGNVVSNSLYKDMFIDSNVKEKFEKDMKKSTEEMCMLFIQKMQSDYKVDAMELGQVAAATFGRGTGTSWNNVICNTDLTNIKVNVEVKVDNMGRGDY